MAASCTVMVHVVIQVLNLTLKSWVPEASVIEFAPGGAQWTWAEEAFGAVELCVRQLGRAFASPVEALALPAAELRDTLLAIALEDHGGERESAVVDGNREGLQNHSVVNTLSLCGAE